MGGRAVREARVGVQTDTGNYQGAGKSPHQNSGVSLRDFKAPALKPVRGEPGSLAHTHALLLGPHF